MPISTKPVKTEIKVTGSSFDIQGQIQNALIKILPLDLINNTLNLVSWLILMWILIYGGGKLADIGIKLIK